MLGAIAGDIIGSVYEWNNTNDYNFPLFQNKSHFTDDTVLTVAVAEWILTGKNLSSLLKSYTNNYPRRGYGSNFLKWAQSESFKPYNSWGNGSAMRVSPIGFSCNSLEEVMEKAKQSAEVTHNHPEGIKGAQAVASAIFLAKTKKKKDIQEYIESAFGYDLSEPLISIKEWYKFDVSCQGSVPQSIIAFLESESLEDSIRKAVSIGGDSDTIACITGGIAEAYFGIPQNLKKTVLERLDEPLKNIVKTFYNKYMK